MPFVKHPENNNLSLPPLPGLGTMSFANPHEALRFFVLNSLYRPASPVSFRYGFLQNLNTHLEAHFSDSTLTVEKLLLIIGMSRTNLHRKLIALTEMSATEYIRCFRLSRAAELMEKYPEKNMAEIANLVGFENQSYFTKKFKEVFGCCPRSYREQKMAEWTG